MYLIVGLGNPGPQYEHTRHNAGFLAAGEIARRYSFGKPRARFHGAFAEGVIGTEKAGILWPQTYMNESGRAVAAAQIFYKTPLRHICVLHDEIDLALGRVKAKQGGSSAGHNGLRSIDRTIGADYWRIRLGIAHPGARTVVKHYVLNEFTSAERPIAAQMFTAVASALPTLLAGDSNRFMTDVSRAVTPFLQEDSHGI
ncbi:MAG TPA: aminoacyl-tRNA hydrolase [Dongiaceae bacterium]|jgi:PTH1 family peptidyl-tRNA hydrolase|nr:aminoacyl-tRNA hydrolase [Dongiaceae bacterium]